MKLIPIVGLLPYTYLILKYKSYNLIFFNGLLYHYNHRSTKLRVFDTFCNFYCITHLS